MIDDLVCGAFHTRKQMPRRPRAAAGAFRSSVSGSYIAAPVWAGIWPQTTGAPASAPEPAW
jgi:hypothetical protein